MSDDTLTCKIDGCDYAGSHIGLRSHVHGQSDEQHTQAAKTEAWEDWYPQAYGIEADTDDPEDDEGPDPGDQDDDEPDPEGGAGTAATADSDDATPDSDTVAPDTDEYTDQYRHTDDPEPDTVDAGTAKPVDADTPNGGGMNWGVLLAGAAALAGAVLLSGRSSDSGPASPPPKGDQDVPNDPNDALAVAPESGDPESTGPGDSISMEDGEVFG